MDGVEILNQVEIPKGISIWLLLSIVALFICGCVLIRWSFIEDDFFITAIFILAGLVIFSVMVVKIKKVDNILKEPSVIIEYQVTIDDNVSMNEFNDKYEVIKVDGKIYTVREKDGEQ